MQSAKDYKKEYKWIEKDFDFDKIKEFDGLTIEELDKIIEEELKEMMKTKQV